MRYQHSWYVKPPLVRVGITAEGKLEPVPLQDEAHRTIEGMDCRDGSYGNSIFLMNNLIDSFIVEFVQLDLLSRGIHITDARGGIPCQHFLHLLDGVLRSVLGL